MYLYSSEHALMDYHLNPEKKQTPEAETPKETKKNETDTTETE
jgi:hypothetical protein